MKTKIALITGGSRGLGKNMALRLAESGHDVILTYHTKKDEALEVVKAIELLGMKAVALQLDVASISGLDQFISNVSTVLKEEWNVATFDFLINNAGVGATIPFTDATEEDFDNLLNVHFKSVYFLTQKALTIMNDNGSMLL
jgi:NAD(P)-dependent dehydrogenase (short-subunit alcohol dehydrogenase family)